MTLDYHSAGAADTPEARVLAQLQRRYALGAGMALGSLALGAGVILLAGLIVASVLTTICWRLFDDFPIGYWGWFWLFMLGIVPLLIREERRSQGSFFSERAGSLTNPMTASSYGEYQIAGTEAAAAAYVEMMLWGPRQFLSGLAALRGQQPTRFLGMLERASRILVQLLRETEAIEFRKLIVPGEPPQAFRETLKWLDRQDYIGISSDGRRVWLSSRMREKLNAEGILSSP